MFEGRIRDTPQARVGALWALSAGRRLTKAERTVRARAPGREFVIRRSSILVPNRDVSHSTQLPYYVRISVAAVALLDGGA